MADIDEEPRGPVIRPGSLLSAALVAAAMALLYWQFHGYAVPDWEGYEKLYGGGGAWLLAQGRDPVFVWLLQTARRLLGGENTYGEFRLWLFDSSPPSRQRSPLWRRRSGGWGTFPRSAWP